MDDAANARGKPKDRYLRTTLPRPFFPLCSVESSDLLKSAINWEGLRSFGSSYEHAIFKSEDSSIQNLSNLGR